MEMKAGSLDSDFVRAQKVKLEEEHVRLESELQRIARKDPVGADYHAVVEQVGRSPDDNAVEEEQYESARSVEQSLEVKLRDVQRALTRLAAGTYGACAKCHGMIDRQRLDALPSAATCRQHAA